MLLDTTTSILIMLFINHCSKTSNLKETQSTENENNGTTSSERKLYNANIHLSASVESKVNLKHTKYETIKDIEHAVS